MRLRHVFSFYHREILNITSSLVAKMGKMPRIVELSKTSTGLGWENLVQEACESLARENIIAVPTDTIYGLAGLAQSNRAIADIYNIKGRDCQKPISICVGDVEDVYLWSKVSIPRILLEELLPGPVTVVFERKPELNTSLNPNTELVGVRVPDYGFVRDLVRHCGQPLALTSANVSSAPSTVSVQEFQSLWPHLDLLIDGGTLGGTEEERLGSTVVNLAQPGSFTIIRKGSAHRTTVDSLLKHGLKENANGTQ